MEKNESLFQGVKRNGMFLKIPLILLLTAMAMNSFFSSGILFGWTGLVGVFKNEQIYNFCNETENFCPSQDSKFTNIYVISTFCVYFGQLIFGTALDTFGPKIVQCIANFLLCLSSIGLAFSKCKSFYSIYIDRY